MAADESIPARQEYGILHQATVGTNRRLAKLYRRSVACAWIVLGLGCQPPTFPAPTQRTPSGIGVSGAHLAQAELVSIDERVAANAECLERIAVAPSKAKDGAVCSPTGRHVTGRVQRVHVDTACAIDVPGSDEPQQGTVRKGIVHVSRTTRALQHEASVVLLGGYHSHAKCSPTILCEKAGPPALPTACPRALRAVCTQARD